MVHRIAAIFHGEEYEARRLLAAIERNCTCTALADGTRKGPPCAPHAALVDDQRFVNGVLCMRRLCIQLAREEYCLPPLSRAEATERYEGMVRQHQADLVSGKEEVMGDALFGK